jgi:spore coat protein U-like protein
MKRLVLAAAALMFTVVTGRASAATDTGVLTVNATVSTVCVVQDATLAFGAYDPVSGAAVDGFADVSVQCTNGATFKLVLDKNAGTMVRSGSSLAYTLYSDANRTAAFPTAVANQTNVPADGSVQTVTVYGKITANQNTALAGIHTDTVTMTVDY